MLNACPTEMDFDVYQPRNPRASAFYCCVEDHFEQLETAWDERYQSRFCFWRSYVTDVIRRYLDCGDLHFGDFQNFNPHIHVLATDGCFYNDDAFMACPPPNTGDLEELSRHEVFKILKAEGKITDCIIENMINWYHSGFKVYCGKAIRPHNQEGFENLARYITRGASACAERPSLLFPRAYDLCCATRFIRWNCQSDL